MKYQYLNQIIPQESRKELNEKILYLVSQNNVEKFGITPEDIFNGYTGDGGLHGLKQSDFNNYHEYSEAKKEFENGQFFTPPPLCQLIMDILNPGTDDSVADLTAGVATFCNFMPMESNFYGCEVDIKAYKVSKYLYPKANLFHGDIRSYNPDMRFDYVVGNPPFNLSLRVGGETYASQLYYCLKAAELLKPLGIMAIVVPESFLSDDFMDANTIAQIESQFSYLGQVLIPSGAFSYLGVSNFPTKIVFWQKILDSVITPQRYSFSYDFELTDINYSKDVVAKIQESIVSNALSIKEKNSAKAKLVLANHDYDANFQYRVRKMLYHIKSNPAIKDKYTKCIEYIYKFEHQKQPDNMKYEEWAKIRITEAKVLAYLSRVLKSQHKKPALDKICLVKQNYSLAYKAYSVASARMLSDSMKSPVPMYQLVSSGEDLQKYSVFSKLIMRKRHDYDMETMPYSEMSEDNEITKFLDDFKVYDRKKRKTIRLNEMQKFDINLFLQKRNCLLQWEQGSGKTLAGIVCGKYRMEKQNALCSWVVSTAISINNNWAPELKNYGIPYRMVSKLSDISEIRNGEYVLVTLNMLSKYQKHIKKAIKKCCQKVCLIFDEGDEMSNPDTKQAKAVLSCFRKVKYKIDMTGTSTRNNISEIAPQFELLYNNSYNMISWCEELFHTEKSDIGEEYIVSDCNPYYGDPIPAYKPGYRLFAESFSPEKITVFGVGKCTQDIYNSEHLSRTLSYSVITRTLEEIMGKDLRRIHQVTVDFSPEERKVYNMAINEFYDLRRRYFSSTGNSRKDSMMAIIQQIILLLRISAAPNTMDEYTSSEAPTKISKILSMLSEMDNQIVVIGVRHKNVIDAYMREIHKCFPHRRLFIVTGSTTSLKKRKELERTLKESKNGILLCTQQSLPSSVNFEYVNKIIIPELHYNNARMSQFYHRFIRYDSTEWKDIYFVTYSGSIESNQMQMVLAKEKINLFMKGQEVDLNEVYKRFGVDYDLLSLLMSREKDDDGHYQISWGKQTIQ